MAKKLTKKPATKAKKLTKTKKQIVKKNNESSSFSVMALAILGLILLLYFGSSSGISVTAETKIESSKKISESIVISGKTYESKKIAMQELKFLPQSILTDEERSFVESYVD